MSNRVGLKNSKRSAVLKRDYFVCGKCGRNNALQINHIIPVADGGTSDMNNLSTLCAACHNEWHAFELSTINTSNGDSVDRFKEMYDLWMRYPSVFVLIIALEECPSNNYTIEEFKRSLRLVRYERFKKNIALNKEKRNGK